MTNDEKTAAMMQSMAEMVGEMVFAAAERSIEARGRWKDVDEAGITKLLAISAKNGTSVMLLNTVALHLLADLPAVTSLRLLEERAILLVERDVAEFAVEQGWAS
jgi:hypothetical protein